MSTPTSSQWTPKLIGRPEFVDFGRLHTLAHLNLAAQDTGDFLIMLKCDRQRAFGAESPTADKCLVRLHRPRPEFDRLVGIAAVGLKTMNNLVRTNIAPQVFDLLAMDVVKNSE